MTSFAIEPVAARRRALVHTRRRGTGRGVRKPDGRSCPAPVSILISRRCLSRVAMEEPDELIAPPPPARRRRRRCPPWHRARRPLRHAAVAPPRRRPPMPAAAPRAPTPPPMPAVTPAFTPPFTPPAPPPATAVPRPAVPPMPPPMPGSGPGARRVRCRRRASRAARHRARRSRLRARRSDRGAPMQPPQPSDRAARASGAPPTAPPAPMASADATQPAAVRSHRASPSRVRSRRAVRGAGDAAAAAAARRAARRAAGTSRRAGDARFAFRADAGQAQTPVAHVTAPTPVVPATGSPAKRTPNPFLANDPNQKAKRLARALVSDMVAYLPQRREEGLKNNTLEAPLPRGNQEELRGVCGPGRQGLRRKHHVLPGRAERPAGGGEEDLLADGRRQTADTRTESDAAVARHRGSRVSFQLHGRAVLRRAGTARPLPPSPMAESERSRSLKQDADRLTELRRFL